MQFGAVLKFLKTFFGKNMKVSSLISGALALALCLAPSANVFGEDALPQQPPTTALATIPTNQPALSVSAVNRRAGWQQHLTLGPGDIISIYVFGRPETLREQVLVGPDGRLSYLNVLDITASGLSIDDLRGALDHELGRYLQNPRTIITPVSFKSKRYFVLGAVATKGAFTFERPLSLIEAIARAGGLETGLYEQKTVEMVDLGHSFIVRDGKKLSVDFEKLFQHGDLSQNVSLEPNDYLYFATASANEIYVLGEVMNPGTVAFSSRPTAANVIASRGGYTDKSFRSRVLVIRGSLNNPEKFIVDSAAILAGKAPDFKLEPRDIVYVSANPWTKVEDLMDTAARAFLQGMIVEWTTLRVGPLITQPLLR
jgi:protein involved in polysaccharide export with SLBB domain